MLAVSRVVAAVGNEAVRPAVTHEDIAVNYDEWVTGARSSICTTTLLVANSLCSLLRVECVSGIGAVEASTLGSESATPFSVGSDEVRLERGEGLVSRIFLTPREACMIVDASLIEDRQR